MNAPVAQVYHDDKLAIAAQYARLASLTRTDVRRVLDVGVPPPSLSWTVDGRVSLIKRARVLWDGYGGFEFADQGQGGEGQTAYTILVSDEAGEAVDIVAFRSDRWGLWRGATALVGIEAAFVEDSDAVDLYDTPLDWLRSGRRGVLIAAAPNLVHCTRLEQESPVRTNFVNNVHEVEARAE